MPLSLHPGVNHRNQLTRLSELEPLVEFQVAGLRCLQLLAECDSAAAGKDDLALDWLEPACDKRIGPLPYVNAQNGRFEAMRSHPRFKGLLRRMNLPQ